MRSLTSPPSLAIACFALAGCVAPAYDGYYGGYGGGYAAPYPTYPQPNAQPTYPPRYDAPPAYRPYEPPGYDARPYRRDRLDDPEVPPQGIPPAYVPEYGRRDDDRYGAPYSPYAPAPDPYLRGEGLDAPPSSLPPPIPRGDPRPDDRAPPGLGPPTWR